MYTRRYYSCVNLTQPMIGLVLDLLPNLVTRRDPGVRVSPSFSWIERAGFWGTGFSSVLLHIRAGWDFNMELHHMACHAASIALIVDHAMGDSRGLVYCRMTTEDNMYHSIVHCSSWGLAVMSRLDTSCWTKDIQHFPCLQIPRNEQVWNSSKICV